MRLIIVGGGEIGYALSRQLSADHAISVIEHNPDVGERFASLDVHVVPGSGTSAEVLEHAEVASARWGTSATCTRSRRSR